jgi:hypothetical protein
LFARISESVHLLPSTSANRAADLEPVGVLHGLNNFHCGPFGGFCPRRLPPPSLAKSKAANGRRRVPLHRDGCIGCGATWVRSEKAVASPEKSGGGGGRASRSLALSFSGDVGDAPFPHFPSDAPLSNLNSIILLVDPDPAPQGLRRRGRDRSGVGDFFGTSHGNNESSEESGGWPHCP